jgi:hypothetical protein
MSAYDQGRAAHAAGTALTENPHASGTDAADWVAGWSDAQAEATATPPATETPAATEAPAATETAESAATEEPAATETASSTEEPLATEVVASLGDAGYDRIMDLLANPPVDDVVPGTLPPSGEVPEDLSEWLEAWKAPLAFVAVDTAIGAVKTRLSGSSRGRLKELYRDMTPQAMTAAMQANAATVAEFADQRVAEAGLINSMQVSLTQKAAGFLLNALLLV